VVSTKAFVVCFICMHARIFILLAISFYNSSTGQTGKVILQIENIQTKKGGEISAAIFNKTNFLKTGKQLATTSREVTTAKMVFVFDDVPAGEYAFVAYQDIDRNKSMKTNFIGYPKEPWGISNNPRILFGPPSFEESKIKVLANQTATVNIRLN
jgi:uncharacterized protein (DUF2141 family)